MYQDVKRMYWWNGMKKDVAQYVASCLTCQQVKFEHQRATGLLQELPLPEWKWERITMDFVVRLPKTQKGHDSIWVIVDRLTKSAHFLAVKTTYTVAQYAQMYLDSIVALHEVHSSPRGFGRNFRKSWVLNWISVQPSILRQMGSQNGQFRL